MIKARRSERSFKKTQITDEELSAILEAGQYAPTGGNLQTVHFIVIQKAEVLKELVFLITQEFRKMELTEDLYISIQNGIKKARKGDYHFFYDAPTLIVVSNQKSNQNGMADVACAIENIMLEATELGLGNCWVNQIRWLDDNPTVHAYMEKLGLGKNETVCGAVAIGYKENEIKREAPERKGMRVTYVK